EACSCGPGAGFDHLPITKPGRGVLPVRIVNQIAGEGIEGRLGPFPDITSHLTAAKSAIASGEGADVDTAQEARVEIGVLRGGRRIAPGIAELMGGEARTIRGRLRIGGGFPTGSGSHPSPRPLTLTPLPIAT